MTTPKVKPDVNAGSVASTKDHASAAVAAADQKHGLAVAAATAETTMATAQAAVEVARLRRPTTYHAKEHYAAIVIQTAFRGYLVSAFNRSNLTLYLFIFYNTTGIGKLNLPKFEHPTLAYA